MEQLPEPIDVDVINESCVYFIEINSVMKRILYFWKRLWNLALNGQEFQNSFSIEPKTL
jgi:hypothetical protein